MTTGKRSLYGVTSHQCLRWVAYLSNVTTACGFKGQKLRARMVRDVSRELDIDLTRDNAWKKDKMLNRSFGMSKKNTK